MANLVEYMSVYRGGDNRYTVVETGQPQDAVNIGVGATIRDAVDNLEATPMQSVGRDGGESAALGWAIESNWVYATEDEALTSFPDAWLHEDGDEGEDDEPEDVDEEEDAA